MTTAFITEQCLTALGIQQREGEISGDTFIVTGGERGEAYFGAGIDWHETEEAAVARAEVMRALKVSTLTRYIEESPDDDRVAGWTAEKERLEALTF